MLAAIALFLLASFVAMTVHAVRARQARRVAHHAHEHRQGCGHPSVPHGDHVDYLHDGEFHAPHGDHWDAHRPAVETSKGTHDAV